MEAKASTCPLDLQQTELSPAAMNTSQPQDGTSLSTYRRIQRFLHSIKDQEIFWLLHASLIITEAGLVPHLPVGRIRDAQKAVIVLSTVLYFLLILSYVDPERFVDIKTKEEGGVRVEALHPLSGELKLGSLQKYESNYCAGGLVLFDDDAIVSSKGENNTFEKKKIEAQPLLVHEMRIIQSSRGLFVPILGYLYQAVIKRQPLWTLENNNTTVHIVNLETELTMLSIAREQGLEENKIERFALVLGWALVIFTYDIPGISGIAALRAFRLFRILWYYKIPVVKKWLNYNFELSLFSRHEQTAVDKSYRSTLYVAMKLMVQNLESLGREMFTVTGRGGLLLMLIFFYTAFVFGAAYWIETGEEEFQSGNFNTCSTLSSCVYTMMRLTFWDGTGFDYGQNIMMKHKALFALLLVYLCVTAFGMLNGLIGIFGDSFVRNIKRRELQTAALAAQGGGVVGMDFDGLLEDIKGTLVVQGRQLRGLSKKIR